MEAKELIKQNAELQKQLTKENEEYYGKLLIYARTKRLTADEITVETLLLDILQDIIEAQKHGESAEQYFSKNPKQAVDELLNETNKETTSEIIKIFIFPIVLMVLYLAGFSQYKNDEFSINIVGIVSVSIYFCSLVAISIKFINYSIYKSFRQKRIPYVGFILFAIVGALVAGFLGMQKQFNVVLSSPFVIAYFLLLMMYPIYMLYKTSKKKEKIKYIWIVMIVFSCIGIIFQLV